MNTVEEAVQFAAGRRSSERDDRERCQSVIQIRFTATSDRSDQRVLAPYLVAPSHLPFMTLKALNSFVVDMSSTCDFKLVFLYGFTLP